MHFSHVARILIWVTAFAALIPLVRLVVDWVQVNRMLTGTSVQMTGRGFDWVHWQEEDGIIRAAYVFPRGPAAEGGIVAGDLFFMLEYQQYFNADDLKRAIEGIAPGSTRTYFVQRGGDFVEADVRFTRYPTFLYPLSATLWHFSVWGFLFAVFAHVVCLVIVGPLAMRSRKARFSLLLIFVSSLWIVSNLARLLMVELFGPPLVVGDSYDRLFQMLTVVGLIGWIGFPALLVHKVFGDVFAERVLPLGWVRLAIYLPASVLGLTALTTTLTGGIGPITLDGLVAPILFYACCYIAAAAAVMLLSLTSRADQEEPAAGWNRSGSIVMLVLAFLFALSVLGIVPIFGVVTETIAAWLIVGAQLLSVAPVVLVSHATLQHGKVDQVLSRGLEFLTVSGLIFFAFAGGLSLVDPYIERMETSRNVIVALFAVVLLIGVEALVRHARGYGLSLFANDRRRLFHAVQNFQEQMRNILDFEALARKTAEVVGKAFGTRTAAVFLRPGGPEGPLVGGSYHPEPPYLTERVVSVLWPHFEGEIRVWARNSEVNEANVPDQVHRLLVARGAALLVPIMGKDAPVGMIVLGRRHRRRSVYNLEEIDLLRSLSGQLALAIERLNLVEREKALIRESAEAQLVALRAQINPHFLFNSLNTIVSLIGERPDEAELVVEHLAAIFRYILRTGGRAFVTMEDEFELIRHYLSIEQSRFGESLRVDQRLDPELRRCLVPAFAVQTLVENAVKHGLARRRGGGLLRIHCERAEDGAVQVFVSDTGIGISDLFDAGETVSTNQSFFGLGLKNVASRLEQIYGRNDLLHFSSAPEEGTTALIRIPDDAGGDGVVSPSPAGEGLVEDSERGGTEDRSLSSHTPTS